MRRWWKVLVLLLFLLVVSGVRPVRAHDMPDELVIQTFINPEGDRLHVAMRVPLELLLNMDLPKRGPGYLDLAKIEPALDRAAREMSGAVRFVENGTPLEPSDVQHRISIPSDSAFMSYQRARAHIESSPLPEDTNVFWNQGFFDLHLAYPIRSEQSQFALDLRVPPEIQKRLHLVIRFLMPDGTVRAYDVTGASDRIRLDPRWYQAAWTFTKRGFFHILDGLDHLLFLLCLVIPFRYGRLKQLAWVITSFTVAHSITLIGAAYNLGPGGNWFPPLVETLIAASILYMALENIIVTNLQRRWLITGLFGLIHGFGFSYGLKETFQFAGDHLLLSLLSFNVGVELGQFVVLAITLAGLRLLSRHMPNERIVMIVLSALLAHTSWHWMLERADELRYVTWPAPDAAALASAAWGAVLVLIGGGVIWYLAQHAFKPTQTVEEDTA